MRTEMKQVRSVSRVIKILEALHKGDSLTFREISSQVKLPKSTAYEALGTLVAEGLIDKDISTGRYRLGLRILELAYSARRGSELTRIAQPFLKNLNQKLNETVQLTVRDRDEVLYVEGFDSARQLRTSFELGERAPLYCTAVGKAILAFLPAAEAKRIIGRARLRRFTPNTLVAPKRLLRELAVTADRGYSVDNMEHEESVRCIGAPVFDRTGSVVAAMSVSGPSSRLAESRDVEIARLAMKAAREISWRLGYRPSSMP
jgi:DNA-binding IclR family transcriptional regulator